MSVGAYVGMGRSIIGHAGGTPSMPTEHHRWCGIQKITQKHKNHRSQKPNKNQTNNTNQTNTGSSRYIYYSNNILALKWPGSWQLLQQPWKVVEEGPGTVTLERPGTKIFQSCGVWASGRMLVRDSLVTCSLWINRRKELVVTGKSWCVKQLESRRASGNDSGWMLERR